MKSSCMPSVVLPRFILKDAISSIFGREIQSSRRFRINSKLAFKLLQLQHSIHTSLFSLSLSLVFLHYNCNRYPFNIVAQLAKQQT